MESNIKKKQNKELEDLKFLRQRQGKRHRFKYLTKKRMRELPELVVSNKELVQKVESLLFPKHNLAPNTFVRDKRSFITPKPSLTTRIGFMLEAKQKEKTILPFAKDSTYYKYVHPNRPVRNLLSSLEAYGEKSSIQSLLAEPVNDCSHRRSVPVSPRGALSPVSHKRKFLGTVSEFNKEKLRKTINRPRIKFFYTQIISKGDLDSQATSVPKSLKAYSLPFTNSVGSKPL